ncbi:MAG: DUF885 domain-containing protein [Ferruginibacter sp.]
MKKIAAFLLFYCFAMLSWQQLFAQNRIFQKILDDYYAERMALIPLEATQNGDSTQNDKLYADFTDSYRVKLKYFFSRYRTKIYKIQKNKLGEEDLTSYAIFEKEIQVSLEGLALGYFSNQALYPEHQYMPFNQFGGIPLWLAQMGSGTGQQPFNTVKDYDNWIKRASAFPAWADSAIVYFRKGIQKDIVLPAALVKKMIPQMESMLADDVTQSLFYGPINLMPQNFDSNSKARLTAAFVPLIKQQLMPAYKKLADFLKNEYLPKARSTTGINALQHGKAYYTYLIHFWTTTNQTPEDIYQKGLSEVKRIRLKMDSVKEAVGFKGDLNAFFQYMKTDPQFMPFKTPEDVLNAYRSIQSRIEPNLKKLFQHVPKSKFEVRQTQAFRAASASAEYNPGATDGSRPGIFYVPILDAATFNVTTGMEGLFLHEAIPGHHYQISLQMENETLPKFRRFSFYGAYVEGWGLYCESLGKELGVYTDPYQYMGALGKEIHRAIRLVVDAGMHSRQMTREDAIKYMMDNMPVSEQKATAEIERYMAMPAQALSYKTGSLKIIELRKKYEQQLGTQFNLAAFHEAFLSSGSMPLDILEKKMEAWAKTQKK